MNILENKITIQTPDLGKDQVRILVTLVWLYTLKLINHLNANGQTTPVRRRITNYPWSGTDANSRSQRQRSFWSAPTPEVRVSRTFRQTLIGWEYETHAQKIGSGQRSWFLVLTKRSAASRDENAIMHSCFVLVTTHRHWHSPVWS